VFGDYEEFTASTKLDARNGRADIPVRQAGKKTRPPVSFVFELAGVNGVAELQYLFW